MSLLFWLVGVKLGKLSKSITKSPYSPQPPEGVAVAEEAGNELVEVTVDSDLVALPV